jgi:hypothetical protein
MVQIGTQQSDCTFPLALRPQFWNLIFYILCAVVLHKQKSATIWSVFVNSVAVGLRRSYGMAAGFVTAIMLHSSIYYHEGEIIDHSHVTMTTTVMHVPSARGRAVDLWCHERRTYELHSDLDDALCVRPNNMRVVIREHRRSAGWGVESIENYTV